MKKTIAIFLLVAICLTSVFAFTSCDDNDSSSGACRTCGGSGRVSHKILGEGKQNSSGYQTCRSCHGTGRG